MSDSFGSSEPTLAELAAQRLQREILSGGFLPGDRLGVTELAQAFGMGATPIREGLSRLVSQGLIVAIGRRGFRVSEIDREDLVDITRLRFVVEREGLRLSFERGDDAWEGDILATLHRLRSFVRRHGIEKHEGSPEFDELHKAFHEALIAGCGSKRIRQTASQLYDQAYRYRRLMMKKLSDPGHFIAVHEELADVALKRDFDHASHLLQDHLETTLRYVYPPKEQKDCL